MDSKDLGDILKKERKRRGLSQAAMALLLDKSRSAYVRIESGKVNLPLEEWNRMFRKLDLKPVDHGIVIHAYKKPSLWRSRWWRWLWGYLIWDFTLFVLQDGVHGPDFRLYIGYRVIAVALITMVWYPWPPPWPFTKERLAIMKSVPGRIKKEGRRFVDWFKKY